MFPSTWANGATHYKTSGQFSYSSYIFLQFSSDFIQTLNKYPGKVGTLVYTYLWDLPTIKENLGNLKCEIFREQLMLMRIILKFGTRSVIIRIWKKC